MVSHNFKHTDLSHTDLASDFSLEQQKEPMDELAYMDE